MMNQDDNVNRDTLTEDESVEDYSIKGSNLETEVYTSEKPEEKGKQ